MERPSYSDKQKEHIRAYDTNLAHQIGLFWGCMDILHTNGAPLSLSFRPDDHQYVPYSPEEAKEDTRLQSRVPYKPIAAFQESLVYTLNSYLNRFYRLSFDGDITRCAPAQNHWDMGTQIAPYMADSAVRSYIDAHKEEVQERATKHIVLARRCLVTGTKRTGTQMHTPTPTQAISDGIGSAVTATAHLTAIYGYTHGSQEAKWHARTDLNLLPIVEGELGVSTVIGGPATPNKIGRAITDGGIDRTTLRETRSIVGGCPAGWHESSYPRDEQTTVLDSFIHRVAQLYETTVVPWFLRTTAEEQNSLSGPELLILQRGAQIRSVIQ